MGFDDTFRQFMDKFQMPDFSAVDWKGSVDRLRQQFYVASRAIERDAPEMANISLITIPGPGGPMKARIYTPRRGHSARSGNHLLSWRRLCAR